MIIEEAKEILESRIAVIKNNYPEIADYRQALELAVKALEKRIPEKPNYDSDGIDSDGNPIWNTWICPRCDEYYEVIFDDYKYCPNCGQHITHSEKGENEQINNTCN
jgi:hypothetical protein|nr:MAG TPA: hydrogenase/urease nickel incorporation protein [Caudoviricetes sp.]